VGIYFNIASVFLRSFTVLCTYSLIIGIIISIIAGVSGRVGFRIREKTWAGEYRELREVLEEIMKKIKEEDGEKEKRELENL